MIRRWSQQIVRSPISSSKLAHTFPDKLFTFLLVCFAFFLLKLWDSKLFSCLSPRNLMCLLYVYIMYNILIIKCWFCNSYQFCGLTNYIFIHSVFCLTTGPKPPPKRCLHIVGSRASSFKLEYPLPFLRSSSRVLRLFPCLLATSIFPFIFPSITCFRRQFLRKMWPIQLSFRFLISCRMFLCSLTLSNTSLFLTLRISTENVSFMHAY